MTEQTDRRAMILETLHELCGSADFPEVSAIEANDDLTHFTVALSCEAVTPAAFTLAAMLEMYTRSYHMVQGKEAPRCSVRFVSADTGETIEEMN